MAGAAAAPATNGVPAGTPEVAGGEAAEAHGYVRVKGWRGEPAAWGVGLEGELATSRKEGGAGAGSQVPVHLMNLIVTVGNISDGPEARVSPEVVLVAGVERV